MQPQFTGFPGQPQQGFGQQPPQQQPQFTGFPGQQQQQQQSSFQQPAQQQQPFQTGAPLPAQPQRPQPTGMTSSQIADSFRGASSQAPPPLPAKTSKIPNIRLSFITAQDQAKFEQLFKSAVGNAQALSGEQARDLLMRSKLSGDALSHIWYVDVNQIWCLSSPVTGLSPTRPSPASSFSPSSRLPCTCATSS